MADRLMTRRWSLILCFTMTLIILTVYNFNIFYIPRLQPSKNVFGEIYQEEEMTCKYRKLDPWDSSILKYISHPKPIVCEQVQPFLTYIDHNGYFRYNDTELKILKNANISVSCNYLTFDRKFGSDDNAFEYDNEISFKEPVRLNKDMVLVRCKNNNDNTSIYLNVHAYPAITDDRLFAEPSDEQLSLLFFLIDSTSYSALQRNMPLTYNYTKNVMGIKYFTRLNKIGSNSFPNQMAYLTGKRVRDEQEDMLKEIPGDYRNIPLNTWPFIWKQFAAKSYATVINEDWPQYGLYNYDVRGFTKKMVDYYYRNFWLLFERSAHINSSAHCFSNELLAKINMDLTRHHVMTLQNKLQFLYSSITDSAHQGDNEVEQIDSFVFDFWKRLYEGNYFNKTVVIFASDHGLRVGWIRRTLVGLLEERLPFYGIWFPPWFYKLHPNIQNNIENNLNELTTSFDVYETLKDIVDANYNSSQRSMKSRGKSQLYPLPKNRNCATAGIAEQYCTCIEETPMYTNDSLVIEMADFVVKQLNNLIENISDVCQFINLSKINYIKHMGFNQKLKQGIQSYEEMKDFQEIMKNKTTAEEVVKSQSFFETFIIGIETYPYKATYEATVKVNVNDKKKVWMLEGEISRTSTYAGLSDCIKDKFLRQYCPCFNVTDSTITFHR